MEGYLWHVIFQNLPPIDLLSASVVSQEWRALALADASWAKHKERVLLHFPYLAKLFDAYPHTGKRAQRVKKRRRPDVTVRGIWYVFAHYLMTRDITAAYKRLACETNWKVELVIRAACMGSLKSHVVIEGHRHSREGFRVYDENEDDDESWQVYWFKNFTVVKTRHMGPLLVVNDQHTPFLFTLAFARIVLCE